MESLLAKRNIDALLVTNLSNIRYVSGFRGTHAYAVITETKKYLFTDPRYLEKAESTVHEGWNVIDVSDGLLNVLHTVLLKHRAKRLGVEAAHVSMLLANRLRTLNGIGLVETLDAVEEVRMVKSASELKLLRQAQRLNEETLKMFLEKVKPGISETQAAWLIQSLAHDLGADGLSFPAIVAFGAHTSRPHHEPTAKKLKRGDMVLVDMGITYKSFASDITRTFFTKAPTAEQGDVYQTVLTAHKAAALAVKPGVRGDDIDRAARLFISDSGYKKKFGHATGHGIGLDVHELPRVAKGDRTVIQPGMVITVEPGIYLPKKFGVRIEDMLEVTSTGAKSLNHLPKEIEAARIKV